MRKRKFILLKVIPFTFLALCLNGCGLIFLNAVGLIADLITINNFLNDSDSSRSKMVQNGDLVLTELVYTNNDLNKPYQCSLLESSFANTEYLINEPGDYQLLINYNESFLPKVMLQNNGANLNAEGDFSLDTIEFNFYLEAGTFNANISDLYYNSADIKYELKKI